MSKNSQHVVPHNSGWSVKRSGAEKSTKIFKNQKEAIDFARELARKSKGELYIHNRDGAVRQKDSYGNDPYPPKG